MWMENKMNNILRMLAVVVLAVGSYDVEAWMDQWAPKFACETAKVRMLSQVSVSNFLEKAGIDIGWPEYVRGGALDLNGDGFYDFVYIVPWMGCGMNADGYDVRFYVSNGTNSVTESVIEGYGVEMSDLVKVKGKCYFRLSKFFGPFEKSDHNHWVHHVYSFDTNGVMRCVNAEFGGIFPAATVFYNNPKFKRLQLTPVDREEVKKAFTPASKSVKHR